MGKTSKTFSQEVRPTQSFDRQRYTKIVVHVRFREIEAARQWMADGEMEVKNVDAI
jgi:hypothetical protein